MVCRKLRGTISQPQSAQPASSTTAVYSYHLGMGQRSPTETLAGIYQAFLAKRTWTQAALARELEISADRISRILRDLHSQGMPLERQEEHPHVYWSVPKRWFPGSVLFKQEEIPELLRQLRRIPHGQGRARLLSLVVEQLPAASREQERVRTAAPSPIVVTREASPTEERYAPLVEDSAEKKVALHMRYLTAGRVDEGTRHASVHAVLVGPPARFVATCHRDGKLKTFRVDGILDAHLDPREAYRAADDATVQAYIGASVDGFHDEGPVQPLSFLVREPEARWVKRNLVDGMQLETTREGIRVRVRTAAVRQVARFVVGLGAAARPESPELAREVEELARGALQALQAMQPTQTMQRSEQPPSPV
jgi:predicted DNA-binding transcriptional regulator YafY